MGQRLIVIGSAHIQRSVGSGGTLAFPAHEHAVGIVTKPNVNGLDGVEFPADEFLLHQDRLIAFDFLFVAQDAGFQKSDDVFSRQLFKLRRGGQAVAEVDVGLRNRCMRRGARGRSARRTIKQSGKISRIRRIGFNQYWCGMFTSTLTAKARSELAALHSKIPMIVARLEIAEDFA